jgi:hypothetical protein
LVGHVLEEGIAEACRDVTLPVKTGLVQCRGPILPEIDCQRSALVAGLRALGQDAVFELQDLGRVQFIHRGPG